MTPRAFRLAQHRACRDLSLDIELLGPATQVPAPDDLRLNQNHAKYLPGAVVLYADIDSSTDMVDKKPWWFCAEIYKAYLRCAARIIKKHQGNVTAYDGDRVMAIFFEGNKNTNAVRAALELNYAVHNIIRPLCKARYPNETFELNHAVGVASSDLRAVRIGMRNDEDQNNDITWVGKAANHAAKLCALKEKPLWITEAVYNIMRDDVKYTNGTNANSAEFRRLRRGESCRRRTYFGEADMTWCIRRRCPDPIQTKIPNRCSDASGASIRSALQVRTDE